MLGSVGAGHLQKLLGTLEVANKGTVTLSTISERAASTSHHFDSILVVGTNNGVQL